MVSEVPGDQVSSGPEDEHRVFRVGGISYLRIPAEDSRRSAAFYEAVFGWSLRGDPDDPSFEDGTGHVIGHFMTDLPVAGEAAVPGSAGSRSSSSDRAGPVEPSGADRCTLSKRAGGLR